MARYVDLIAQITKDAGVPCGNIRLGIHEALDWIDRNPDQVPGHTITESQLRAGMKAEGIAGSEEYEQLWGKVLGNFGITIAPDPKSSNAEKLADLVRQMDRVAKSPNECGTWLDMNGVTAPGGDDEY